VAPASVRTTAVHLASRPAGRRRHREIAIKFQLGELALPEAPTSFVPSRLAASGCTGVAIEHAHALRAGLLPPHHRDPFDRLLIAQAQILGAPLASGDRVFDAYDVELLWD
jgi:PIN domain nuclease of toxin-antitoxin system